MLLDEPDDAARYLRRTPAVVNEVLSEYGTLVQRALFDFLPDHEPKRYLYDLVAEYPRRAGRMMRPALCLASAKAHGASIDQAMDAAIAVELLHNALLVIDDIQDGSEERRGKPSLHRAHGIPLALNAGSALTVLSLVPLLKSVQGCGPFVALRIFEQAVRTAQACAEGQAIELGWRADNVLDVTPADYLRMVLLKTCSYSTIYPLTIGALIGTGESTVDRSLTRYGYFVGAAFQIQDDILNLDGDHLQYGKELGGDIWEGKRTLITISLLEDCTPEERERVVSTLGKERTDKTPDEVDEVLQLIRKYGSVDRARRQAQAILGAARHEFARYAPRLAPGRDRAFIEGMIPWVIEQLA